MNRYGCIVLGFMVKQRCEEGGIPGVFTIHGGGCCSECLTKKGRHNNLDVLTRMYYYGAPLSTPRNIRKPQSASRIP
jgi:hypothetical protein